MTGFTEGHVLQFRQLRIKVQGLGYRVWVLTLVLATVLPLVPRRLNSRGLFAALFGGESGRGRGRLPLINE